MMKHYQLQDRIFTFLSMMSLWTLSSLSLPSIVHANGTDANQGLPEGTVGGGSRSGSACNSQEPLLAFVPGNHVLKTTEAQTTLWFYLPDSDILTNAELIVYDETNAVVIDTSFSVAERSGLLGVNLNLMVEKGKLDLEKNYRWFFSLICPDDRAADLSVDGWVQTTSLSSSFTDAINSVSPVEQANLYIQEGLWSEAVLLLMNSPRMSNTTESRLDMWNSVVQTISPAPVSLNFTTASQVTIPPAL
ncbi:MAG: DUF928 domain-containing protein [Cyanobacteria bacterium P01_F01_bin.150]